MSPTTATTFLFSIDLEDVRLNVANGLSYKERVPGNVHRYLRWLQRHGVTCTFFTTGKAAERYPGLLREIVAEGHEVACHTHAHLPISQQTPQQFKKDLEENISALLRAGVSEVRGFRAPTFSLTSKTQWAYQILSDLNFSYSSSVLPARNPLYGWQDFGNHPRKVNDKILEIPITVGRFGPLKMPPFGGIYFRSLPFFLIKSSLKKAKANGLPVIGYFHPYDIDTEQERFMHPGINDNKFYNSLMYYNRSCVFQKLDALVQKGLSIKTYKYFVSLFKTYVLYYSEVWDIAGEVESLFASAFECV